MKPTPGSDTWLGQVRENIIEPERPIIDPHHHLWRKRFNRDYLLNDLWADTGSGHRIRQTVFIECRAFYDREAEEHLAPLGETRTITALAKASHQQSDQAQVNGIVGRIDLRLGHDPARFREVVAQHQEIAGSLFKGIRQPAALDQRPEDLLIAVPAPPHLYSRQDFRAGLQLLGKLGMSYDAWHYHHQNADFLDLADAVLDTPLILNHFGTPLGVGVYQGQQDTIYAQWKDDIRRLSYCPNVYAKLGGLAMPDNGFGWDRQDTPPNSDDLVRRQRKYYLHVIECFGPQRCMFESNFPVDRLSVSYHVLWNAFKKMVSDFSEDEKHAIFYGTAERVYKLV